MRMIYYAGCSKDDTDKFSDKNCALGEHLTDYCLQSAGYLSRTHIRCSLRVKSKVNTLHRMHLFTQLLFYF